VRCVDHKLFKESSIFVGGASVCAELVSHRGTTQNDVEVWELFSACEAAIELPTTVDGRCSSIRTDRGWDCNCHGRIGVLTHDWLGEY
jgi:hypothetical protein